MACVLTRDAKKPGRHAWHAVASDTLPRLGGAAAAAVSSSLSPAVNSVALSAVALTPLVIMHSEHDALLVAYRLDVHEPEGHAEQFDGDVAPTVALHVPKGQ